jgi:hypothetical protein
MMSEPPIPTPFPEPTAPTAPAASRAEVFLRYLDYFRSRLAGELLSMERAVPRAPQRACAPPCRQPVFSATH